LIVARLLTGVALGAGVATATAYIADLDAGPGGAPSRRSGIVATVANVGGLALGPLLAGALARYVPGGVTLTFLVLLAALVAATGVVLRSPEGREPAQPRPRYRPQRLRAPAQARGEFIAATTGAFLTFAVAGLLAGLAGTFLAGPFHHPSSVLTGLVIFLNFGAGVLVQTTTAHWPTHRLIAAGIAPLLVGLSVLVASAWVASLALFLTGAAIAGVGGGAIIAGSLRVVVSSASADDRAGALATYFTAGYVGLSLPVLGAGVALQFLSPRVTLLLFAAAVGLGVVAAAPLLIRPHTNTRRETPMNTTRLNLPATTDEPAATGYPMAFEVTTLPVSDVDRAKAFYLSLGWRLDIDFEPAPGTRGVQLTPPGSAASIQFGSGPRAADSGPLTGLLLIVDDIEAAREDLVGRGIDVTEIFSTVPGVGVVPGIDPERRSYVSRALFSDPDGNEWQLQEITERLPGRV
jgi:MFS family permease